MNCIVLLLLHFFVLKQFLAFGGAGLGDDFDTGYGIDFFLGGFFVVVGDDFWVGSIGIGGVSVGVLWGYCFVEGDFLVGGVGECFVDVANVDRPFMDRLDLFELNERRYTLFSSY